MTIGQFLAADAKFRDDLVLAPHNISIPKGLRCPLLAAAEGFLRVVKLSGIVDFLSDAQPFFFLMV
jgi:hypothetical protein